jgi:hypothetical protein
MARARVSPDRPIIEIADVLRRHGDAYKGLWFLLPKAALTCY